MNQKLVLNYTLGRGALAPYLDALVEGVALAGHCAQCGRTSFPPERLCRCARRGERDGALHQQELSGQARILYRTDGPAGSFALAQFEGADNQTVCGIANPQVSGAHARLRAVSEERPGIVVQITGKDIEING